MTSHCCVTVVLLVALCSCAGAKNYYVTVEGNVQNPGTMDQPFKTIQRAADVMKAEDMCYVGQGLYADSSGIIGQED